MPSSTDILSELGTRLRDPDHFAHSTAVLNRFIDHVQRVVNYTQRAVLRTVTLNTTPHRVFYRLGEVASDCARVEMIRQGGRNLIEVPWKQLVHNDRTWLRKHGQRAELFARIGGEFVVIVPALSNATALDVVYTTQTPAPTGAPNDVQMPPEYTTVVTDIVEILAHLRGRRFAEMLASMERLPGFFAQQATESVARQGSV